MVGAAADETQILHDGGPAPHTAARAQGAQGDEQGDEDERNRLNRLKKYKKYRGFVGSPGPIRIYKITRDGLNCIEKPISKLLLVIHFSTI